MKLTTTSPCEFYFQRYSNFVATTRCASLKFLLLLFLNDLQNRRIECSRKKRSHQHSSRAQRLCPGCSWLQHFPQRHSPKRATETKCSELPASSICPVPALRRSVRSWAPSTSAL